MYGARALITLFVILSVAGATMCGSIASAISRAAWSSIM